MSDEVDIVSPKRSRSHGNINKQPNNTTYKVILGVILLVVVVGISFYSGVSYQKKHGSSTTSTVAGSGLGGAGGGFGGRFSGSRTIGTVSAISPTSITVQPTSGASAVTYSITSSTTITDSGQTVAVGDIQTGVTVLV